MKEIIFVRHAKSDWGNELLKDIDRPLNERGYTDAYTTAEWYAKNHAAPDLILSSTATRALSTALIFSRTLGLPPATLQLVESIYESGVANLRAVIAELGSDADRLMLFGHNPGFTNICNELADDVYFDNIPTCGMVSFQFEARKWSTAMKSKGTLNYYHFPKDFRNRD